MKKQAIYLLNLCVPDKDTTSVTLRPTFANLVMIASSFSVGPGRLLFAPVWFDTRPSLLPNTTFHAFLSQEGALCEQNEHATAPKP